ncbi:MAG: deoxyribose-phosphate aldolase [Thermoprotei archaeon]|nr:MAG: deoxyribose-phosphate aldolase [Thermoprotei archaeon]
MNLYDFIKKTSVTEFAKYLDHTLLKPNASYKDLEKAIEDTYKYGFACLVVPPSLVSKAREIASGNVRLATVIGFPLGNTFTEIKVEEARLAIDRGVKEIDMVMNINLFKSGLYDKVLEDIKAVVNVAKEYGDIIVKVIIETGLLSDEEKVRAAQIVVESGADFVKTCTGFVAGRATIHDVMLLSRTVKGKIGVKASGGIRHAADAISMIMAGASRIGTSTAPQIIEEFIKLKNEIK